MIVLYIAGRWPWPVNVGRQRMIDQTLRIAAEVADVHMLAFASIDPDEIEHPAYVRSAAAMKPSGAIDAGLNVVTNPMRPLQCQLFNSGDARKKIDAAIKRLKPDVVIFDMARLAPLAEAVKRKHPDIRLVLDMDDMLSVRYRRMLKNKNLAHIAGTFEKKLPRPLRALARSAPRTLVRIERPLMRRLETKAYGLFDAILMVSPAEAEALNTLNLGTKALGFPPLIEERPRKTHDHSSSLRFVFIGNANYAPNAEALLLLDRAAGRVKVKYPTSEVPFRFEIAGMPNAALRLHNLDVKGFVDDLSVFLSGDAVLVAPILTGTGIKTKIVDALEQGTPIITTDVGAEGLAIEPNTHFIRVEAEDDLVAALEKLVTSREARDRLAPMGQAALDRAYSTANRATLLETLKKALAVSP